MAKIYICDACKFLFTRANQPDLCPDCGKEAVREADINEQDEFEKRQQENLWDK